MESNDKMTSEQQASQSRQIIDTEQIPFQASSGADDNNSGPKIKKQRT